MRGEVVVVLGLVGLALGQYSYRQDRASSFLLQVRYPVLPYRFSQYILRYFTDVTNFCTDLYVGTVDTH